MQIIMDKFIEWTREQGIRISPLIEIQHASNSYSIKARDNLQLDTVICSIPKSCIFSVTNSRVCRELEGYTGALALTIALCVELAHFRDDSPWKPYFDILPDAERSLPLFWFDSGKAKNNNKNGNKRVNDGENTLALRDMLEGTEVAKSLDQDTDLLMDDYKSIVKPLCKKHKWSIPFELFRNCGSVVASRCFEVDEIHGDSLVPVADLFNHRTSTANIHLESSGPDCASEEEFMKLRADVIENSAKSVQSSSMEHWTNIELRVVVAAEKGDEVFNTYGDHSNAYMLLKYGFCERDNPYDVVSIEKAQIVDYALGFVSEEDLEMRLESLDGVVEAHVAFIGEEEDPIEIGEQYEEDHFSLLRDVAKIPLSAVAFIMTLLRGLECVTADFAALCSIPHEVRQCLISILLERKREYLPKRKSTDSRVAYLEYLRNGELEVIEAMVQYL
eukprot:Partr_v1_DN24733_c0_g1_i1_m37276 putative SET domain containing